MEHVHYVALSWGFAALVLGFLVLQTVLRRKKSGA